MEKKKEKTNVNQEYLQLISSLTPKTDEKTTLFKAFWVGGFICMIGQSIRYFFTYVFNLYGDNLASATSIVLIFLGALLTGFGVYDKIGKYAGAGSIVPITGFANSVVSPAIEFKTEGYVYGLSAKIFVIAGPIIVFGVISSSLVGLIYYFLYNFGLIAL